MLLGDLVLNFIESFLYIFWNGHAIVLFTNDSENLISEF